MQIFDKHCELMETAMTDLDILAGNDLGNGSPWQDVAGTAAVNLRALADFLDVVRKGERSFRGSPLEGPVVFASPSEVGR